MINRLPSASQITSINFGLRVIICPPCRLPSSRRLVVHAALSFSRRRELRRKCLLEDGASLKEISPESPRDTKATTSVVRLNPRNTFESFVVGPNNEIAHAASLAVAQSLGPDLQPALYLRRRRPGKTHLMQAIGQYVWAKKKTKVMYSPANCSSTSSSMRSSTVIWSNFRKRYRQADLL